ncbi:hypothetical protein Vafri_21208 [Volvox africanus]|uniref:Uncharacterized protein n=1 Tax=Volvox africanus TaxID=51714 RepID=A0A8J4BTR8_9CHLO|nr:hypothetical protein Vafri_21208 [Volvox africanus]
MLEGNKVCRFRGPKLLKSHPPSRQTQCSFPRASPRLALLTEVHRPQVTSPSPQLRSRHLTLNPLHGLAAWAGAHANWLDLAFAYGSFSASVGGTFNQSGESMAEGP